MKKKNTELTYRFRLGKTKIIDSKVPFLFWGICLFLSEGRSSETYQNDQSEDVVAAWLWIGPTDTGKMATKNPVNSPVEVGGCLSNSFTRFLHHPNGGFLAGCLNHQQYTPED